MHLIYLLINIFLHLQVIKSLSETRLFYPYLYPSISIVLSIVMESPVFIYSYIIIIYHNLAYCPRMNSIPVTSLRCTGKFNISKILMAKCKPVTLTQKSFS